MAKKIYPFHAIPWPSISDEPEAVPITRSELLREQEKDEFCRPIRARLRKGEKASFADNEMRFLCRYAVNREQLVLPLSLQNRGLWRSHYNKLTSHPGGRRLLCYLIRYFYWPSMSLDCYSTAINCATRAKNRPMLRKKLRPLTLFPAQSPLEFVAIDILGELIRTPRGNRFIIVISSGFSKLVRVVPMKTITQCRLLWPS